MNYEKKNVIRLFFSKTLQFVLSVFFCVFDEEFPEIAAIANKDLIEQWRRFDFNKEIANANIQMVNFLTSLDAYDALARWNEIYEKFRMEDCARV